MRSIVKKYEPKTRIRLTKSPGNHPSPSTDRKAIKHVSRLRPQKDMEGAIVRKREKRMLVAQLTRRRKLHNAAAKRRMPQSKAKRAACDATSRNEGERNSLFQNLMEHVVYSVRGKRKYTRALVEKITKVGTSPSAGGSRSAIASILSHNGDQLCGKVTTPQAR